MAAEVSTFYSANVGIEFYYSPQANVSDFDIGVTGLHRELILSVLKSSKSHVTHIMLLWSLDAFLRRMSHVL